jgi:hypothetical protein
VKRLTTITASHREPPHGDLNRRHPLLHTARRHAFSGPAADAFRAKSTELVGRALGGISEPDVYARIMRSLGYLVPDQRQALRAQRTAERYRIGMMRLVYAAE